ncbi:Presequence translocated-associated motor subunit PAM17, mitochondrial OS=Cryptococcus neoformans var, neoformans serotype D (strain JEC21 / ATCC MYA-565) GN=PAM17 PE=3 SV=1 [Rhizoctonia solani AG-1 IB]|uniref:Presequence translocated-associated motor subunit PAM17 n=1 Tax=Thanatephorus cucumeris (strain AG1-IB / isolate 7/3/14) TaxID=1108050 RepID=A0A0B7FTK4_THACB|nr:Presequence translocated-associated motor subunit PAM17, mitochondrial OS=Cryptococcus neoformans var, neoformans serotype D (strain JEC21 / ATCC MYA-565) GN=PAM17 PE=3 SV=1 [Rhizoctonia solani AG-1 IB]
MYPVLRARSGNVAASTALVRHTRMIPGAGFKNIRLSSTNVSSKDLPLSWPEYLTIRRKKRRWEIATTIPSTFLALTAGLSYFGSIESDPTSLILGVEPIYIYGLATMGCGGLGYLLGPVVGNSLWRMTHRQILPRIEARDAQFYQHIVKNRVDPSRQTATNPVPDFYGEKIGSLRAYRQWLRDQARYKRKAQWPEE